MDNQDFNALETLIDRHGLAKVLEKMSEIASLKAEHIKTNWQDNQGAKMWVKASNELDYLSNNSNIKLIS